MKGVLEAEGFDEYPNSIINKIVSVCDGSPGEALAILDSIIEITDEDEALKAIEQHLWGDKNIIEICRIMADPQRTQKWEAVSKIIPLIQKQDVEELRYAMLTWFEKILIDRNDTKIASVMILLTENFMYTGRPGLTLACYLACRKLENYKDDDDDIPF